MSSRIALARSLADFMHGDQKYAAQRYVTHLDAVAEIVTDRGEDAVVIAYLHDSVEDTPLLGASIENIFGATVAACVDAVTDPPGANRKERKAGSYAKLAAIEVGSQRELALVVKAADRLANVRACVREKNTQLLEMYRGEQPTFRSAVRREALNEEWVREIDALVSGA